MYILPFNMLLWVVDTFSNQRNSIDDLRLTVGHKCCTSQEQYDHHAYKAQAMR
jgi:hypothetical protein